MNKIKEMLENVLINIELEKNNYKESIFKQVFDFFTNYNGEDISVLKLKNEVDYYKGLEKARNDTKILIDETQKEIKKETFRKYEQIIKQKFPNVYLQWENNPDPSDFTTEQDIGVYGLEDDEGEKWTLFTIEELPLMKENLPHILLFARTIEDTKQYYPEIYKKIKKSVENN
jgi:hypothetical protein